jgi:hypothetical protein
MNLTVTTKQQNSWELSFTTEYHGTLNHTARRIRLPVSMLCVRNTIQDLNIWAKYNEELVCQGAVTSGPVKVLLSKV